MSEQSLGRAIRYRVRGPLIVAMLKVFARLSLRTNHRIGALLGRALYRFSGEMRYVSRKNIALCFPDWSEAQREALVRTSIIEAGKAMTEMAPLWLWDPNRIAAHVVKVTGQEHLDAAMASGKGVLMITPHLGCWEINSIYISRRYPMTNMYRPHRIEALDRVMRQGREQSGARLVPTDASGIKRLLQALKQGEISGLLPDQQPTWRAGQFVPFFGVPAYTLNLFAKLACKVQPELLAVYAKRLPAGQGYEVIIKPMPEQARSCDELESLRAMNLSVEEMIRACPEQYQWSYRRFGKRPHGEPRIYERSMKQ